VGIVLERVSEDELAELHDNLAGVFRCAGLSGHDLDAAVAAALTGALGIIELARKREDERREKIRLVE
jgi:hypothetical protein